MCDLFNIRQVSINTWWLSHVNQKFTCHAHNIPLPQTKTKARMQIIHILATNNKHSCIHRLADRQDKWTQY